MPPWHGRTARVFFGKHRQNDLADRTTGRIAAKKRKERKKESARNSAVPTCLCSSSFFVFFAFFVANF